jgi:hypothetical protein
MMRSSTWFAALASLLLTGVAQADFTNWSASWSLGTGQGPNFVSGFSDVAFALSSPTGPVSSTLPVGTFSVNSSSTPHSPDSFNAGYDLSLRITDNTTHDSGVLTFHGLISGSTGPGVDGLTNTFSDPSQTLSLDGHAYHVSVAPSTTIPDAKHAGILLNASVSVDGAQGSGSGGGSNSQGQPAVQQTPEPSGLVLAGLGLALCGVCRKWPRRRARQVV